MQRRKFEDQVSKLESDLKSQTIEISTLTQMLETERGKSVVMRDNIAKLQDQYKADQAGWHREKA
jgi:septal ring factor EnvC (AmiA/AmiB activator)